MKTLGFLLAALAVPAWAGADFACIQNCSRQGYDQSQCITICQSNQGGPGLTQQPGVPRNPYLDALPDPVPKSRPTPRYEPKCVDRCVERGYQYQYCRKQCSY